jgi:anti-anti-sigma factor
MRRAPADMQVGRGLGQFTIRTDGRVPVVDVQGTVDMTTVKWLDAALHKASALDRGGVIVVLDGATYFDSQGMELLFRHHASLRLRRQVLHLVIRREHHLRRLFEIAGITAALPVSETVDDAIIEPSSRASAQP